MKTRFSAHTQYRILEALPGITVWVTFAFAIMACLVWPVQVIGFALIFDTYWFVRILYLGVFVGAAYRRYQATEAIDWKKRIQAHEPATKLWHLIMIPTVAESEAVLEATLTAVAQSVYHPAQTIIVLATEQRSPLQGTGIYERITAKWEHTFGMFGLTIHPAGLPGDVVGKGSNTAFAGRLMQQRIDERQIPYQDIIVTTIDADSILHPQYLAYLAWIYAHHPRPTRTSYQPIPLFHNNIWDALPWMRVVSYSTTFWLMGDTQRPDRLFTFSSHSMPWQALVDVGFWQTDVVSEDSRIFLQCLIRYDGDYEVTPMYLPISMDAIQAPTFFESLKNQYKQIRRWAYGAENFPFMVWNFMSRSLMSFQTKLRYTWYQLEGMYSWAVAPMLIMILGWLPFRADPGKLSSSVLAHNAPMILKWLMVASLIGAVLSALLNIVMLPRKPHHVPWYQWVFMIVQWGFLPVTMILFGSIPAIESQSRLMLGRYLGFWVTDKHRRQSNT